MDTQGIRRVVVIGTGHMGPGIAQSYATSGRRVTLVGRTEQSVARGLSTVESNLQAMQTEGLYSAEEARLVREAIAGSTDLEASAAEADLVVESIVEDLATKRELFNRLDRICPADALLTTNTSGIRISDIAREMTRPERAATTHYWNPPHLMPLVEIVQGERTSEETVRLLSALLEECGKRPVVVRKDVLGQLANRIFHAIKREAFYIVQEGIATAEEVDDAVKMGFGLRFPVFGPLEHTDLNGLEMSLPIHANIVRGLCNDPEALPILHDLIERGDLGARAGKGFCDWSQKDPKEARRIRDQFLMARVKEMYPPRKPRPREGA